MTPAHLLVLLAAASAAAPPQAPFLVPVYQGKLAPGWNDYGWAPRKLGEGPARLDLSRYGGWTIAHPAPIEGGLGALVFRYKAPAAFGRFLEVRLDGPTFQLPAVTADETRCRPDGEMQACRIPLWALAPHAERFDRIVFRARRPVPNESVLVDGVGFTAAGSEDPSRPAPPARSASLRLRCGEPGHPISPLIYGIAYNPMRDAEHKHQWELGATARRWGGNPSSRFNWQLGNAWNTANDYFFRNANYTGDPRYSYERFLDANHQRGLQTALTVPTLGWVAKDTTSYSFPVSVFGPQKERAPENPDMGNGLAPDGGKLPPGPPNRTSVKVEPGFIGRWIAAIRERDSRVGHRSVGEVILDNEPMLWHDTHRDVHPEPVTYDELLERTVAVATEVRRADPEVLIAGPALWGWPAYFYSAADAVAGFGLHPDRLRHGNKPLLPWWLEKMRQKEKQTGLKLLDVVDVHFYPQGKGIGVQARGSLDADTNARRLRAPRALWDKSYYDESWIDEPIRLIPRLREWVAQEAPGLRLQIGEWNMGAEEHISGGLAVAETLGRFAQEELFAAYYWDYPAKDSPAAWAFRAYRNFDGNGGRFLDEWLPASSAEPLVSIFASRDPASPGHVVAVVLNLDPDTRWETRIDVSACGALRSERSFAYQAGAAGFLPQPPEPAQAGKLALGLPPYSMAVLDLGFAK